MVKPTKSVAISINRSLSMSITSCLWIVIGFSDIFSGVIFLLAVNSISGLTPESFHITQPLLLIAGIGNLTVSFFYILGGFGLWFMKKWGLIIASLAVFIDVIKMIIEDLNSKVVSNLWVLEYTIGLVIIFMEVIVILYLWLKLRKHGII